MAVIDQKEFEDNIQKKGFRSLDGRHRKFFLFYNGKKTGIWTETSHGHKEIGDSLLSAMAKQMKRSRADCLRFGNCTMSQEEYIDKLKEKGFLT